MVEFKQFPSLERTNESQILTKHIQLSSARIQS